MSTVHALNATARAVQGYPMSASELATITPSIVIAACSGFAASTLMCLAVVLVTSGGELWKLSVYAVLGFVGAASVAIMTWRRMDRLVSRVIAETTPATR